MRSSTNPLDRVFDAVLHSSIDDMQNKYINPCKFNTITVLIVNHGNKFYKPDEYIYIYLDLINQVILYQIEIIKVNDII